MKDRMNQYTLALTWKGMKLKLKERFLQPNYDENLYDQLVKLEQDKVTMHEYMERFNELTIQCGVDEGDKQALSRFRLGFRSEIQRETTTLRFCDIDGCYRITLKIDSE